MSREAGTGRWCYAISWINLLITGEVARMFSVKRRISDVKSWKLIIQPVIYGFYWN
jgi:hypothetical protein